MASGKSSSRSERSSGSKKNSTTPPIPNLIYAQASPHSIGGVSLFDAQGQIDASTIVNFFSQDAMINQAVTRLQDAGFEVLQVTAISINIAGSAETYQRAFNTTLFAEERPVIKSQGERTTAAFMDSPDTALPGLISTRGTAFEDVLEGVALEVPRYFMAASAFAPPKAYWHLDVPAGVSLGLNADRAHRIGVTGSGVKVAMVDSGWFKHPFFVERGYRVSPVVLGPATVNPLTDDNGHGTAESANIFAVAPDCELTPIKMSFVNSIGAFNAAVGLNPDIITCSWGSSIAAGPLSAADQALAAAIAAAVAAGITVIFSAGNGHLGFPGQHPDVISAGGVFMRQDGTFRASDYASGFMSGVYPGRRCPDVSGLVGMKPRAAYIMLPLQPGCSIDTSLAAGGAHPNSDETAGNDGWAAISGTSAAAPQLAGAAALIKQACKGLKPADIKDILMKTARDVTTGASNTASGGHAAGPGPDLATGNGLADAHKAVMVAKVRCLGPVVGPIPPGIITPGIVAPSVSPKPPSITPPSISPKPPSITPPSISPKPPTIVPPSILPKPPIPPIGPKPIGLSNEPQAAEGEAMPPESAPAAQAGQLSADEIQSLEDLITGSESGDLDLGL